MLQLQHPRAGFTAPAEWFSLLRIPRDRFVALADGTTPVIRPIVIALSRATRNANRLSANAPLHRTSSCATTAWLDEKKTPVAGRAYWPFLYADRDSPGAPANVAALAVLAPMTDRAQPPCRLSDV